MGDEGAERSFAFIAGVEGHYIEAVSESSGWVGYWRVDHQK